MTRRTLLRRLLETAVPATVVVALSAPEAARFPNSVTMRFAVTGEAARDWAAVLGLPSSRESALELPLDAQHLHAVRLRDPARSGEIRNVVRYAPGPPARLTLEGEWLDSTTGSRVPVPRYTVSSTLLGPSGSTPAPEAWQQVARGLHLSGGAAPGAPVPGALLAERSSDARQLPWLRLAAYRLQAPDGQWGYLLEIGVDDRSPTARSRALAEFAARKKGRGTLD